MDILILEVTLNVRTIVILKTDQSVIGLRAQVTRATL